jgi:DNA-binding response OmpR family regulator
MKRVAVYTKNMLLARRLQLILRGYAKLDVITDESDTDGYHAVFIDRESFPDISIHGTDLPHISVGEKIYNTPILHTDILAITEERNNSDKECMLTLSDVTREAILRDEKIKLTDLEYKLLSLLLSHNGYVDRTTILREVWDGKRYAGVVNVYIHYLRGKLESGGEKIIISSRRDGYAISPKYRGGRQHADTY